MCKEAVEGFMQWGLLGCNVIWVWGFGLDEYQSGERQQVTRGYKAQIFQGAEGEKECGRRLGE